MNQTIFNYITARRGLGFTWRQIADDCHAQFGLNLLSGKDPGEALRSAYRRFKRGASVKDMRVDIRADVTGFEKALRGAQEALQSFGYTLSGAKPVEPLKKAPSVPVAVPMPFDPVITLDNVATLLMSDLHCPYHHEDFIRGAVDNALYNFHEFGQIVIGGDLLDLDALSRYSKAHNIARLETELEITGRMLLYLAEFAPVYITQGNHDARFFDKLDTQLSFKRLISAALNGRQPKNTITTTDRDYVFIGDHFVVGHVDRFSAIPGKTAHAIAQKYKRHALVGHDHIVGAYTGEPNAQYIGASIGCMADSSKFWYSERRLNSTPFMRRGYALLYGSGDGFTLYNDEHIAYFERMPFDGTMFNCFRV